MQIIKTLQLNAKKSVINQIWRTQNVKIHNNSRIGNRDWVGFGANGTAHYFDSRAFPFPAIRFKKSTNELNALREKEKGDWKNLSLEEKKILYRAAFCQTFSEFEAPTGEWKYVLGGTLTGIAVSVFIFVAIKLFVSPPLPESFSEENRAKQLRFFIDMKYGVGTGIASKWDYEKDDWKK